MRKDPQQMLEGEAASIQEVRHALQAMTTEELQRLDKYARYRVAQLGPSAVDEGGLDETTYKELLHQAVLSLLEGNRRWKPDAVDLVHFLIGAMRSISSNWIAKHTRTEQPILESSLIKSGDEKAARSPLDNTPSPDASPEKEAEALEEERRFESLIGQVESLFTDDDEAALVLTCWKEQMKGPEVKKDLGLNATQYNTIVRRIKRRIEREGLTRTSYVK